MNIWYKIDAEIRSGLNDMKGYVDEPEKVDAIKDNLFI